MAAAKKTVGKYEIGRTLGEGTFGKVKYAVNTETMEAVAIKVLDKERIQKQSMGSQIKKEISIMKQLNHRNIVKLTELKVLASRTKIFIVLELVVGGELFDLIVKSGRLSEADARHYFRQLVDGVSYCHSQGVAHRDLKPENLLLDAELTLKISDFGLSALYDGEEGSSRSQLLHTTCGTPNYVAPEVLENEGYDGRSADCWSVGVILYVLLAGFLPFDEPTMAALFQKIKAADYLYPDFFSAQITALIDTILVADPTKRTTLAKVQHDPWFTTDDPAPVDVAVVATTATPAAASEGGAVGKSSEGVPTAPSASSNAEKKKTGGGGLSKTASTRFSHYTSPLPPADLMAQLKQLLLETGCELVPPKGSATTAKPLNTDEAEQPRDDDTSDDDGEDPTRERCEATYKTANGIISLLCTVRKDGDAAKVKSRLELLRGKGDILAYAAFVKNLMTKLQGLNLLNRTASLLQNNQPASGPPPTRPPGTSPKGGAPPNPKPAGASPQNNLVST